jgi:acyl carrier protein
MDPKIVEEVKARFRQIMDIDTEDLDLEARLDDTYGVTSVNQMRLVSELEIALGVEIPEAEGKGACSLAELVHLCERYSQPVARVAAGR